MERPNDYPRAEGQALDALAANMGLTRLAGEDDAAMRRRVVDYIRQPQQYLPVGRRQRVAIWLSQHGMPTFAHWLYRGYYMRRTEPRFVGEFLPRWVSELNIDGSFTYP